MTIVYAIIVFCLLIFAHEFGHLVAAKSVGIRVNEFAFGMGPKILSSKKGETAYSWRIFPIGGFCALEGENGDSDDPKAFNNKNIFQKAWALVAGALMNIVLAVVILWLVAFSGGVPTNQIASVAADTPAAQAGLLPGDEVISVNGAEIRNWTQLRESIENTETDIIVVVVLREGQEINIEAETYKDDNGIVKIGINPAFKVMASDLIPAMGRGVAATMMMLQMMIQLLGKLFTGGASVTELTGPVGIIQVIGEVAQSGFVYLANLTAFISLNLAVVNLLPLPALDGGRIVFLAIRKITGKRITDEMEGMVHFVGIMLLFGLIIFVTYQDIMRLELIDKLKNLVVGG